MGIIKKNDSGLSDDAKKFARSSTVPDEIKEFLSRQTDNLDVQIELYRTVALAANLKADALLAVRRLDVVSGDGVALADALERARVAEMHAKSIEVSERKAQAELARLKASRAMAVNS